MVVPCSTTWYLPGRAATVGSTLGNTSKLGARKARSLALNARERGLLRRFLADWIWPRWRQIVLALLFTGGLAAATAGYPLIIKTAFDSLMQPGSLALPWVLASVVGITACRGLFLYLHQITTARIVTRMVTDIQKAAFAHLINADFARFGRETTGHLV